MAKAPAFQFYPRDWDTDIHVIPMTYEEEGVYWALCRLAWLHGSLPADLDELRMLLKGRPSLRQMERWWTRIGRCFEARDGRLYQPRLERERLAQDDTRRKRSDAAAKRWSDAHGEQTGCKPDAHAYAGQCSASASSSASAGVVRARRSQAAGALAGTLPRDHLDHGFCGARFCVKANHVNELVRRYGEGGAAFVPGWLARLDASLGPTDAAGDWLWVLRHFEADPAYAGRLKAAAATSSGVPDADETRRRMREAAARAGQ